MTECEVFDAALADSPDLNRLARGARTHANSCVRCARILTDLEAIVAKAAGLAATESAPDPPPEIWDQIRRQLEKEGIIHANGNAPRRPKSKSKPKAKAGSMPRLVHSSPRSGS